MKAIQKTKINSVSELKPGDVILCIWRKGLERNSQSHNPLPEVNFRHVCAVTRIHTLSTGEEVFDHRYPDNLTSEGNDASIIRSVIEWGSFKKNPKTACTTSSFGANHRIGGYDIWRLDNIKSRPNSFNPMPNLKGHPGYDLMM